MSPDPSPKLFAEDVKQYPSYSAASVAGCQWVNSGKDKIDPATLQLYVSRLESSPAYKKVVGVGLPGTSSMLLYVRFDTDNGIHFSATQLSDPSKKLTAALTPTVSLTQPEKATLYLDYLKELENRSAQFIWEWWSTGRAPA